MVTSKYCLSTALLSSVFLLALLAGCATAPAPRPMFGTYSPSRLSHVGSLTVTASINFAPSAVLAYDLQEFLEDEIILYYAAQVFSPAGESLRVSGKSWSVNEVKKGSVFSSGFQPISLEIPPNGAVVFSARLEEVDDYAATEKLISILADSASITTDAIAIACGGSKKKVCAWSELLGYIASIAGTASGPISGFVAQNDILGECSTRKFTYAELTSAGPAGPRILPCKFNKDGYHYEVRFHVGVAQSTRWIQP